MKNILICIFITLLSCCSPKTNESKNDTKQSSLTTIITCPHCSYSKKGIMPTESCQIKYTCEKCKAVLFPKEGDCCVFCTYGDKKCPSMQND